ncbi:MAG: SDR family NAD(P)-dependent oxidoreductase [Clostridiales bacterium]|nr:SDR family NAD(P)-dependent oxidoreductase [Clostridiales bacterium]
MPKKEKLMNQVVIITGASSGIGEQLKLNYQKDGDTVVNMSLGVEEDKYNYNVDVSNRELVFATIDKIFADFGKIDVLINCAGFGVYGAVELLTEQKCKAIMDVNFFGTLWCCQAALKYMQSGAKIVNIASACALFCLPFRALYSASKSAVHMISYGLRMELDGTGIQVTSICPGDIKTNFSKNRDITLETNEKYGQRIKKSCDHIAEREDGRMDKVSASLKIYKICKKKKLKPMYIIGGKYKFLNFGKNLITQNALLKITNKFF